MSTSGITCSACLTGKIKIDTPTGTVEKIFGRDTYVARPSDTHKAKGVIVILPDLFGWEVSNCRLLADSYAREGGFLVLLPDFMDGTAPPPWTMQTMDSLLSPSPSFFTTLFKKPLWALQIASQAIPFLIRNKESVVMPRMLAFHRALRDTPTPEMEGLKIGSAGFCWGGKYTILLSHGENGESIGRKGKGVIDAAFVAHPSKMAFPSDWEKISVPFSMAIGDVDLGIGIEHVREIQGGGKDVSEVVVYEGAKHGFAVRGDWEDEGQRKSAEAAKGQALGWFGRWLV
ncbi:dienelactone hydrolase family protein [Cadophora sp. DSE1049]|nr:dienelactone hydrolase family protein [Cadophora sp. DSE1049]